MRIQLAILLLLFNAAFACGDKSVFQFGMYYSTFDGHEVDLHTGSVVVKTGFLDELSQNPNGELLSKHREEVAYAISRSDKIFNALCVLDRNEWDTVVDFYESNPQLWGLIYDPPWMPRDVYFASCADEL